MKSSFLHTLGLAFTLSIFPAASSHGEASVEKLKELASQAHKNFKDNQSGKNADYIPALAKVPSTLFGIVIVTVNGDIIEVGDVNYRFSIQSCSKVFTVCNVIQESGSDVIFKKINVEPTGEAFNSIRAIEEGDGRADNPLVNAGAIATVSLVKATTPEERWAKINETFNQFAGEKLTVLDDIFESEASSNFRNRGMAHVLFNSENLFCDPLEATEVYTKECSIGVTAKQLGIMGATLANRGVNPVTKVKVIDSKHVPKVLSTMMMNGFYDGSGSWAWRTGLPAKTGVGGGIFAVVPGKMCIAAFSPPLDEIGNSVRAQQAIEMIATELELNLFGSEK
jgi:glutaminase